MKRILLITLLIVILLFVNFPKTYYNLEGNATECNCIGISDDQGMNKKCYGLVASCREIIEPEKILFEEHNKNFCGQISCSNVKEYLGIDNPHYEESTERKITNGINLLLVIDTSFSMEGNSIQETKDAAIKLIEELTPNDYAAIVTFNNKATLEHEFSTEKTSLIDSINNIEVKEDTRYIPALNMAEEMFKKHKNGKRKDTIIFLSDGDPLDDETEILNLSSNLKKRGIEIYTVRFGKVTSKREEDILNKIASQLQGSEQKGFFVSEKGEELFDSFKAIYENIAVKENIFSVNPINFKETYEFGDTIIMDFEVLSTKTENTIPGYSKERNDISCVDNAVVIAVIADKLGKKTETPLTFSDGSYYAEIDNQPLGDYQVFLNITYQVKNDTDCYFHDYIKFGSLNITEQTADSCKEISCDQVEDMLKDITKINTRKFTYDDYNRKEMLIAVDTSESMRYDRIISVKDSLSFMIDLFLKRMDLGLIDFNEHASYTQKITSNPDMLKKKIERLGTSGTTQYVPAFEKVNYIFSGNSTKKRYLLLISDGISWDKDTEKKVAESVRSLTDKGVCIYTLGLGKSALDNPTLKEIAKDSNDAIGCGEFFHSFETELKEGLRSVYQDIKGENGGLDILLDVNSRTTSVGKPISIDARVFSEFNGFELPSTLNKTKYDSDTCLPKAIVNISLKKGKEKIFQDSLSYHERYGYTTSISLDSIGLYNLTISATATDNRQTCTSKGKISIPIQVGANGEFTNYSYILIITDIIFLILILYLIMGKD